MAALSRGQASDCTYPVLDIFTTVNGVRTDVAQLEYQVFEKVSDPDNPVQVYPPTGRATADVSQLCPTGAKLGTGQYVAAYTPDLTELIGTHEIRWYFKLTLSSPEQQMREEFEVLAEVVGATSDGYTTVSSLRDEGVTTDMASDARLQKLISLMSQRFDNWTGRWFEPRSRVLLLDGRDTHSLLLDIPIIRITKVLLLYSDFRITGENELDLDGLRIYNRHLTQGLLQPDDRENPRIEWSTTPNCGYWPQGNQNIQVEGVFGYTDPDGSAYGRTPPDVQRAVELLVVRDLKPLGDIDGRFTAQRRYRVTSMTTRDQSIAWGSSGSGTQATGAFSGDPEIDNIVAQYCRPPLMGSA